MHGAAERGNVSSAAWDLFHAFQLAGRNAPFRNVSPWSACFFPRKPWSVMRWKNVHRRHRPGKLLHGPPTTLGFVARAGVAVAGAEESLMKSLTARTPAASFSAALFCAVFFRVILGMIVLRSAVMPAAHTRRNMFATLPW